MEPIHGTTVILGSRLWTPSRGPKMRKRFRPALGMAMMRVSLTARQAEPRDGLSLLRASRPQLRTLCLEMHSRLGSHSRQGS